MGQKLRHMRAKRISVVVLAALVLAAVITWLCFLPRTPQYGGKTLSEWLIMLDPDVDHATDHEKASEALRHIGKAALPELGRILHSRPSPLREYVRGYAVRWHLMKPAKLSFQDWEFRAARAAYHLAEDADLSLAGFVPDLRFHLTNSSYAETEMARALARAGPEGIACLTNLLAHGERRVRGQAARALALDRGVRSQPGAQDALIQSATSDPDPFIRANALIFLSSFQQGAATNRLVSLGLQSLKSDDGYTRWAATLLLQNYLSIPDVAAAFPGLASDPDERVRSAAAKALEGRRTEASPK